MKHPDEKCKTCEHNYAIDGENEFCCDAEINSCDIMMEYVRKKCLKKK